ncbi:MAG: Trigger factor [Firmicutes bacterium]|nr:Trigger factor [candidate division NPL-UPA2 bacterium]
MNIAVEKLDDNKMLLEVTIAEQQVEAALDAAFRKAAAKINVPGFRRGKVPRQVFEARYGVESLYEDAVDALLPEAYGAALDAAKVEPLDRPDVDVVQFAKGKEAKLRFTVELMPAFNVGEYKGVQVTKLDASVTDAAVDVELKKLQERHARLVDVAQTDAQIGDTVFIDYRGAIDGVEFAGGTAERQSLVLGSGSFIPGFEGQLIGMGRDETRNIRVVFPPDYRAEHLAGKEATFAIKLHEIKRKELPALDDDFAKEISDFETLAEFTADLCSRLTQAAEKNAKTRLENDVVAKVVAQTSVDVPKVLAEREIDSMIEDMSHSLTKSGLELPQYLQRIGRSAEELRGEFRASALERVKTRLVLEKIGEIENISVDAGELNAYLQSMADSMGRSLDDVRRMLVERGQFTAASESLRTSKTIDFLVQAASIQ